MERKEAAVMSDTYRDCLRQYGLKSTKARNLVLAVLSRQQGVITVEGKMVERLHLVMAKRVAAIADAIAARSRIEEPWF